MEPARCGGQERLAPHAATARDPRCGGLSAVAADARAVAGGAGADAAADFAILRRGDELTTDTVLRRDADPA